MRYVAEECRLEGPPRAILWAMAYRADRDTGLCWAGQRRIAREAGVSRKSVERWLPRLLAKGELELVEEGSGPQADTYRVAPAWVEGDRGGQGLVEGQAGVGRHVEGQAVVGEVIHKPEASGDSVSPLQREHDELDG
jgi:hypothetical protein